MESMSKHLSTEQRRAKAAAAFQLFAKRYARKARSRLDPNDRGYDRHVAAAARRMRPEAFDALLRYGEDEVDP